MKKSNNEIIESYKKAHTSKEGDAVIEYVNSKLGEFPVTDKEARVLQKLADLYDVDLILKAVDVSADTYIGIPTYSGYEESLTDFVEKIGGILYNWSRNNAR